MPSSLLPLTGTLLLAPTLPLPQMIGVGYRAAGNGNNLTLNLGYSHPVEMPIPAGLAVSSTWGQQAGCRQQGQQACRIKRDSRRRRYAVSAPAAVLLRLWQRFSPLPLILIPLPPHLPLCPPASHPPTARSP